MIDIKPVIIETNEFQFCDKSLIKSLFGISDNEDSDSKVKVSFFNKNCPYKCKTIDETSMGEVKPTVNQKIIFEQLLMSIIVTSFLQVSDCQYSDAKLKVADFANKFNMASLNFSIHILVKKNQAGTYV